MTALPGLSHEELRQLLVSVGTHRRDRALSPLEVAELLRKALASGATRTQLRSALQLGATQLSTFLRLLELSPEIRHLAGWAGGSSSTIPFSSVAQLAALPRPDQLPAAEAILRHRLSWKEVVQLVQMKQRSGQTFADCVEALLRLRPKVVTHYVFLGEVTEPALVTALAALTQAQRDGLLAPIVTSIVGAKVRVGSRLGVDKFSLVSDMDLSKALGLSADLLERLINDKLTANSPHANNH